MMIISSIPSSHGVSPVYSEIDLEYSGKALTHALTADDIGQPTEQELPKHVADRAGNLDTETLVGGKSTA